MFSFIPIYNTAYTDKVEKTTFLLKIDISQPLFSFIFVPTSRHECFRKEREAPKTIVRP